MKSGLLQKNASLIGTDLTLVMDKGGGELMKKNSKALKKGTIFCLTLLNAI